MKSVFMISLSAAALWAGTAAAQCANVEPVIAPQVRLDPLDAAGPGELMQPLVLSFHRAGVDTSAVTIRYQIVDEDSFVVSRVGLSQGPQLVWQSSDSTRDIGAFRSEAYPLLRTGQVTLGEDDQSVQARLFMRLTDLRSDLSSGVYREQYTVRYWCGDADQASLPYEAQGAIAVSVAVPNVLSANIAGASTRGEIDFMDFAVRERELQVSVRSTGPYRVTARSQNGGVMLRDNLRGAGDQADRINYDVTFDNAALSLDGAGGQPMPRAGLLGRQFSLGVTVGDVAANRAGDYADTIFLTLSPVN
ncbi:hypothetical protein [Brevundimonas lenta]|uniref:Spore coat protein U domain-containing protein n=1 Tax=Brevundimonas lenta TaxID=424796 RepID=A0A7W6JC61_9CAUL|nr:hypothetical protein [Brevundimonas lenta]MBB4082331.1 hypothetical protein [Brevundimonas lenta]